MRTIYRESLGINNQKGLGLIELLVSVTIGLLVLAGVVQVMLTSVANSNLNDGQNRIQENMRYILSRMQMDASQAGSFGCYSGTFHQNAVGDILVDDNALPGEGSSTLSRYDTSRIIYGLEGENPDDEGDGGSSGAGEEPADSILFRYVSSAGGIPFERYQEFDVKSSSVTGDTIDLDVSNVFHRDIYSDIEPYDVLLAASCSGAVYFMVTDVESVGGEDSGEGEDSGDDGGADSVATISLKPGVSAPSDHKNAGQANREITVGHFAGTAQVLGARLRDENDPGDLSDDVAVGNWVGINEPGTRPRLYSTAYSNSVIYKIEDSVAAKLAEASCSDATPEYCALTRDGEELAEGVEDMQIEYGWHVNGAEDGALRIGSASDVPLDQWNFVDRVIVTLTLNSVQRVFYGAEDDGEALARKTFTTTIALKNQISDTNASMFAGEES